MKQDLRDISDGKLYGNNDMAKISCHDCRGCSSCCRDMGDTIWLDPYDVFSLTLHLRKSFEELLKKEVELHVEDGLILPNLRMVENLSAEYQTACSFLNEEGRCSIHPFRPGFCRLFPLGRNYEDGKLAYFVLKDACPAKEKSKIKINKWLNVPKLKDYENFLIEWHTLTKALRAYFTEHLEDDAVNKAINMKCLQLFYMTAYEGEDFYSSFSNRMEAMKGFLHELGIAL
jgi:Fe-S-cluster containining protein